MMRVKASEPPAASSDVQLRKTQDRAHPAFAKVSAGGGKPFARLRPHLAAAEARLRRSPQFAAGLDAIVGAWTRLVDAFCETIDPYLSRYVPELQLVATLDPDGTAKLHRIARDSAGKRIATREPSDVASLGAVKWTSVELRLRLEQVLMRTLALPGASREFLGPILDHRMERLTPWKTDKVIYGYRVVEAPDVGNLVNVELVATSRDIIAGPIKQLAALGLAPTAIGADSGTLTEPLGVTLQASGRGARPSASRAFVSRIALATLGVLVLVVAATAVLSSTAINNRDETSARLLKARRLLRNVSLGGATDGEKSMLGAKQPDRAMVVLVDRLAATIPTDTFLKEMAVTPDKVRLVGLSGNAPALVGKLEAAGLANVRFASGVTREKDGRDRFEIVAERHPVPLAATP